MENEIWEALPVEVREQVDQLLVKNYNVMAIKAIRDASGETAPGIPDCLDLIMQRYAALGWTFDSPGPVPPA